MNESILVIAGSDSIAGAGVQIDIKTAAAHGVHATTALTAVTAQNTAGVFAVQPIDPSIITAQVEAVFDDIAPKAIKIGMVGCRAAAEAVAASLARHPGIPVVLDPVLVATAGGSLADDDAVYFLMELLAPLATVITPNLPEACALSRIEIVDDRSARAAAARLLESGADSVLIKGGHHLGRASDGACVDRLYLAGGQEFSYRHERLPGEYHGTGCSLSTAIASNLAVGMPLAVAVSAGTDYIGAALAAACGGRALAPETIGTRLIDPFSTRSHW